MFRSSTIIRELALNMPKVIFTYIKTFGKITTLFITWLCGSMTWNGVYVACCAKCTACNIHNRIINNDVISLNILI